MSAEYRVRNLPTTCELVPEALLSLHLAHWRGAELRPLVRQRLKGLMRPEVDSISLNDEGVLRVILTGDAVSAQLALLGEAQTLSDGALLIYCDLREIFDLPNDIEQLLQYRQVHMEQPLDDLLLQWLLETVTEPDVCVELGLVNESASLVLDEFLEQQNIINRQGRAIELLSALCKTLAAAAARTPEADLAARVINQLKNMPPQGMVDGEASYWDEIDGFTDDPDEMPPMAIEDIQKLAVKLVASLPRELFLALQLGGLNVHDWILQRIEDDEVPPYLALADFGSEDLTEQVAERVLEQALNFDPALRQISYEDAETLCLAVIEGREDLWASDLSQRLIAVGSTFPGLALFEQAAHAYSERICRAALRVVEPFRMDVSSGSFLKELSDNN